MWVCSWPARAAGVFRISFWGWHSHHSFGRSAGVDAPKFDCIVTDAALASQSRAGYRQQAGRMYPATDHLPTDAEHDDVDWYVRKFRLETAEGLAREAPVEVPEVRSRKWLVAVVVMVIGLSALLALATFAVSGQH